MHALLSWDVLGSKPISLYSVWKWTLLHSQWGYNQPDLSALYGGDFLNRHGPVSQRVLHSVWSWLVFHSQRGNHQLHLPTVLGGDILRCTKTLSGQRMHLVWNRDILKHNGGHRVKHLSVLPGRGIPDWDGCDFQRCVCPVCCWNLLPRCITVLHHGETPHNP